MRKRYLAALAAVLAANGLAVAQSYSPNPPPHAWGPMGPPPRPMTSIRIWTPPAPVLRAPVQPYVAPPPEGMAGWPYQPASVKQVVGETPQPPATLKQTASQVPVGTQLPSQDGPPALFNTAPVSNAPLPPAVDHYTPPLDNSIPVSPQPYQAPPPYEEEKGTGYKPLGFWASGEYLLWWIKNGHVPPLVTAGGDGVLSTPGTEILLDNLDFDNDVRSGGRFALGYNFKSVPFLGIEANYFFLADRRTDDTFSSNGTPVLARPFINISTGAADAALIASPGTNAGSITVGASSWLWGMEGNLAAALAWSENFHLTALGGFRFLNLEDELKISEQFAAAANVPVFGGSTVGIEDHFRTVNRFYGGQVGLEAGAQLAMVSVDLRAKVAIGSMRQTAYVTGATALLGPDGPTETFPGGLLALPTNSGRYHRFKLAYIPEVGLNVGVQLTHHIRLLGGYSVMWTNTVNRAGEQIDPIINVTQLPTAAGAGNLVGPARPRFQFHDTGFWAQGLNFGLEINY